MQPGGGWDQRRARAATAPSSSPVARPGPGRNPAADQGLLKEPQRSPGCSATKSTEFGQHPFARPAAPGPSPLGAGDCPGRSPPGVRYDTVLPDSRHRCHATRPLQLGRRPLSFTPASTGGPLRSEMETVLLQAARKAPAATLTRPLAPTVAAAGGQLVGGNPASAGQALIRHPAALFQAEAQALAPALAGCGNWTQIGGFTGRPDSWGSSI